MTQQQQQQQPPRRPEPEALDAPALANRRAKGRRPQFLGDPAVERVLSITMAVATELAVARERIDTLERLLCQRGLLGAGDIDAYTPDAAAQAGRSAWSRDYLARVLRIVEQDAQAMRDEAAEPSVEQWMTELGRDEGDADGSDGRTPPGVR